MDEIFASCPNRALPTASGGDRYKPQRAARLEGTPNGMARLSHHRPEPAVRRGSSAHTRHRLCGGPSSHASQPRRLRRQRPVRTAPHTLRAFKHPTREPRGGRARPHLVSRPARLFRGIIADPRQGTGPSSPLRHDTRRCRCYFSRSPLVRASGRCRGADGGLPSFASSSWTFAHNCYETVQTATISTAKSWRSDWTIARAGNGSPTNSDQMSSKAKRSAISAR